LFHKIKLIKIQKVTMENVLVGEQNQDSCRNYYQVIKERSIFMQSIFIGSIKKMIPGGNCGGCKL